MSIDEQQAENALMTPQYTRMLAYIVAGSVFAAGIYSGFYDTSVIAIIPLTVIIPMGQRVFQRWLQEKHPDQADGAVMLTDAMAVGIGIAAAGYSLVPTMTFLSLLLATAMVFGNLYLVTDRKSVV